MAKQYREIGLDLFEEINPKNPMRGPVDEPFGPLNSAGVPIGSVRAKLPRCWLLGENGEWHFTTE